LIIDKKEYSSPHLNQPKNEYVDIRNRGIRICLFAAFSILVSFTVYGYTATPENLSAFSKVNLLIFNMGIAVFVTLIGGLVAAGYGVYQIGLSERIKRQLINVGRCGNNGSSNVILTLQVITNILSQREYLNLFLFVLIGYAILFSFISRTIIFMPDVSFSQIYGITVPSWAVTLCCNIHGFVPMFTTYLSDNMILLIIPINIILAIVLSALVSTNVTLTFYLFKNKLKKNTNTTNNDNKSPYFSGISATATSLFTACPTCAGTFFSTILGITTGTSAISTAAFVITPGVLQVSFILLSIPILIVTPYLTVKNIKKKC
jgi:hypothetical protein